MKKRFIVLLLSLALLIGAVQAYVVTIEAPPEIQAGAPLEVTGTTTFPAGTQFDIILYRTQFTTPEVVDRRMIVVDETKEFDASFPTTALPAGKYKLEVQFLEDQGRKPGVIISHPASCESHRQVCLRSFSMLKGADPRPGIADRGIYP